MSTKPNEGMLTEETVLRCSRQYDAQAVRYVKLRGMQLRKLGTAFTNFSAVVRLDISRNNLTNLTGVELIAPTLQYLNASENHLSDVSALSSCQELEVALLEGNRLGSEAALRPLTKLRCLRQLMLRRELPLDNTEETLELDNPICEKEGYLDIINRCFKPNVIVDGRCVVDQPPAAMVAEVFKPYSLLDTLEKDMEKDPQVDREERLLACALADCAEACRKSLAQM
uniref:Putative leucine-rich repeat protein (LRRP) n=1 Tax=Trypanosoma congolense (strain IL3000) TaxID=1068625 RepID=G0UX87_TRYCI|nr:putative leucine-rich repeat protein (LRRP) [Trypanosoma congolense IL3000]